MLYALAVVFCNHRKDTIMNKLIPGTMALLMTLGLAACSQDDNEGADFGEAGDNIDNMADDASDSVEETYEDATGQNDSAWDKTKDAAEDAGEEIEEAAKDASDAVKDGYNDMTQ